MSWDFSGTVADAYARAHEQTLRLVDDLSNEQLTWRAGPAAPSIGFHLWHIARWADFLQGVIIGPGTQVWEVDKVVQQWGFAKGDLGFAETGMGMDDDAFASLPLPAKALLLDYVRRAFAGAEEAVASIDDEQLHQMYAGPRAEEYYRGEVSYGNLILRSVRHENRHLGMIECLRGVQGVQ